ncbi:MAG: energy-coupling factor ABC transporter ATP-binding protein [Actinobacteria bacterium]|nr:energy-coupling factor ABC transporter ATP-binding protein [Actinomycetota bacterium]MBU1943637.1 energy-coupling factor ABC transporter ATP-binding protein [Actinomycetota bacterium]MBU2687526.1 energy-coupling factor ABC transporter ATP-binding protein [Actinomycetota bacterium]
MAEILSLESVSYSYPLPGEGEAAALREVSFEVEPGEVFCVAGPNGSGKSTLAQVCAGLLSPTGGSLLYGGEKVEGRSRLRALRKKVGLLFQSAEDQLFADTVEKDIAFGPRCRGVRGPELDQSVRGAAELAGLDLEAFGGRSPFALSEGERRRAALAGVLALSPDVLVLDEPFIGLDYEGRTHLAAALTGYRRDRGASIIVVTHELAGVWPLADRFAVMDSGSLLRVARREDLAGAGDELGALGMQLPDWAVLARELAALGAPPVNPSDPDALADAAGSVMGGRR